nr:hypothetical protein [Tanacetum cinerariifolium]
METHDDEAISSRSKCSRQHKSVEEDVLNRMGRIEILQEAIERMEYMQSYHWDSLMTWFEKPGHEMGTTGQNSVDNVIGPKPNPDTTFLAASCGYKIYYCDSTKVSEAPVVLIGHAKPTEEDEYLYTWPFIKSVDFCLTDRHLLCSCDSHGEVHIWNVESRLILCKFKKAAGASHVKFQSRNMLAISAGRRIMLFSLIHTYSGEIKETSRFNLEVSSSSRGVFGK